MSTSEVFTTTARDLPSTTISPGGAHHILQVAPWAALRLFVELPGTPFGLLQGRVAGDHHLPEERHRDHLEILPYHRNLHPSTYLDPLSLCLLISIPTMLSGRGSAGVGGVLVTR